MAEIIDGNTIDMVKENLIKLQEIYPEAFTEGKVDPQKLLLLLGEDVDSSNEKYSFTWNGKNDCIRLAQTPSKGTLLPCKEESVDWDTTKNLYIEGDNLEVLKLLQKSYLGRVKMIYIDPPYNTGSDFVYEDDFADNIENYKKITGQINKSNAESAGRYHTNWLNMIYPRLKLARTLLRDDGAIFIHIDENEVYTLQAICKEIFGQNNELGTIVWDKRNPKGEVAGVAYQHESILIYCKNIMRFAETDFSKPKEHALEMMQKVKSLISKYGCVCEDVKLEYKNWLKTKKDILTGGELAYALIDDNGDIYRPVSMAAPDKPETRSHRPLIHPLTKKECPVPEKGWRFTDSSMDELLKNNQIEFGKDESVQPTRRYWLKENLSESVSSLLYYGGSDTAMGLPFDNPKPVYVAKKIIQTLLKGQEDIVLDFFSGSSTTAHAVMELNAEDGGNRKFIMVQLPELCAENSEAYKAGYKTICEIGKERIRRAGQKIKGSSKNIKIDIDKEKLVQRNMLEDGSFEDKYDLKITQPLDDENIEKLDIGFRVFKLDTSNLTKWNNTPTDDPNEVAKRINDSLFYLQPDRTDEDFVYEIMLKLGMPLSNNVEVSNIEGKKVYGVKNGAYSILICLEYYINFELVEKMAESEYEVLIFADRCFADANMLINTEEILKKKGKTLKLF